MDEVVATLTPLLLLAAEVRAQSALDGFNPGANADVTALAVQADGKILVGGFFTGLGGVTGTTPRNKIGRLTNTDAAFQELTAKYSTTIFWLRSGASPEIDRVAFELSTDAINYSPLPGNPSRITGGWQLGFQSLPTEQNVFIRARGFYATGYDNGSGLILETVRNVITLPPPLVQAVSQKTHGAGSFGIHLPLTGKPGIECRSGGPTGDYTMIFIFANPLISVDSASVSSGTGRVSSSAIDSDDAHQHVVNLTGVTTAQYLTVTLNGVLDSTGRSGNVVGPPMGVLLGDTTGNGSVNASDVSQTKSKSGQAVSASNFRTDVTVSGSINSSDVSIVKSKSGTALP